MGPKQIPTESGPHCPIYRTEPIHWSLRILCNGPYRQSSRDFGFKSCVWNFTISLLLSAETRLFLLEPLIFGPTENLEVFDGFKRKKTTGHKKTEIIFGKDLYKTS